MPLFYETHAHTHTLARTHILIDLIRVLAQETTFTPTLQPGVSRVRQLLICRWFWKKYIPVETGQKTCVKDMNVELCRTMLSLTICAGRRGQTEPNTSGGLIITEILYSLCFWDHWINGNIASQVISQQSSPVHSDFDGISKWGTIQQKATC